MSKGSDSVAKAKRSGGGQSGARGAGGRSGIPTSSIVVGVVVLLVAAVVIGGVLLSSGGQQDTAGPIPVEPSAASYPTSLENGVIVVGGPAPSTVDVYEDPLCPACAQFEQQAGEPLGAAVEQGRVQARFHMVNLLDSGTSPQGYSSAAGNALMCAAENGAFPTVHRSLYAAQPAQGSAGYSTEQLVGLGQAAGAGPGYAPCVRDGRHISTIAANFEQARNDPALQREGTFGTPTIVVDGILQEQGSTDLNRVIDG